MPEIPISLQDALGDRYVLSREVGAGGMATVYLADDLRHGRQVAIKVLRQDVAEAVGSDRFLREIEIAASLTHPHVLPLHDSGEGAGFLYYVMPYIEGETLADRLEREGALPIPEALRLFRQIVDALGAAHERDIVHRDVKPANVLLAGGHALVADFGIAKAVSQAAEEHRLTSVGVAMGTPLYMAPEQATANPNTDHRADLFAAGAIAYEMLTGRAPFDADNTRAILTALLTKEPKAPHVLREAVPERASDLVMRCLEKEAINRPQTAAELLERLDDAVTPPGGVLAGPMFRTRKARRATLAAVAALVAIGTAAAWRWHGLQAEERWARQEAVPEVLQLVGENRTAEAARLAFEAEAMIGSLPELEAVWPRMATPYRITTDPPGANIQYRLYSADEAWQTLGTTPFESERFPVGAYRFRIELDGFEPVEKVRSLLPENLLVELGNSGMDYLQDPSYVIDLTLDEEGTLPDGMVSVPGGLYATVPLLGFGTIQPHFIPAYFLDRTEVTNEAYAEFVDTGGYEDPALWATPMEREGVPLSLQDARGLFIDATGRPGPATWSLSQAPQGADEFPVAGVSWFEADAYCRWRGRSLPTLFHWARATLPSTDVWISFNSHLASLSNFSGEGPAAVGLHDATGVSGGQDLGGNVREWVTTPAGGDRFVVGGAWSDPVYRLHDVFPLAPWDRDPGNGFRCASYPGGELPEELQVGLNYPEQDLSGDGGMSDEVFRARRAFHDYDRTAPLNAQIESSEELDWGARIEWVSVETPYGERMPIRLHIPTNREPPFEAIVFFGGGNVVRSAVMEDPQPPLDDLIRSGRVLVEPAYDGAFQRNDGRTLSRMMSERAQLLANWVKDLGRTLDYLEERPDIDHTRVAYIGISLGAFLAPMLLPFEERFRAAVLYSGGPGVSTSQSTVDELFGLAHRTQTPVLMLGGRNDPSAPPTHQEALFNAFGTAAENKRFRLFDAGHWPLPMGELLSETVTFLERHMGDVGSGAN